MNSTNETFYPLDYWLGLFGFPYITDVIFAYVITPIWFVSLILSIFSMFILLKTPFFASNFFKYMRLYVANCAILSVVSFTTIIPFTRRFFSITNTYEASVYGICVFWFIGNSLILFSSCIEICLVVERILYLLPRRFKRIKLMGFYKFFCIQFVICILVNVPGIFLFEPAFADTQLDQKTLFRIWYFGPTAFSSSLTGQILNYLGYFFRDILPMALKIIFNSLSIYLVGKYVKNKQRIRAASSSELVNFDRKQTYIAIIMNIFSLLEHLLNVTYYVLYFINSYDLCTLVYVVALFCIALKHLLIFFVLLLFNNLFRNEIGNLFRYAPV